VDALAALPRIAYLQLMSAKQALAEAVAALPDTLSLEEAVERISRALKLKRAGADPRELGPNMPMTNPPAVDELTAQQRLQRLDNGAGILRAPPLPDEALRREHLYEDPT